MTYTCECGQVRNSVEEMIAHKSGCKGPMTDQEKKIAEIREEENRKMREVLNDLSEIAQNRFQQLQSAQQEISRLRKLYEREREISEQIVEKTSQREQKLIEGLRFYADESRYEVKDAAGQSFRMVISEIDKDNGQRARAILAEIGVME